MKTRSRDGGYLDRSPHSAQPRGISLAAGVRRVLRLKKTGHDVFAVNPNMHAFEGDRCYPDLRSIPGGVDGVVIVTKPDTTERIVQDCAEAGVRRVWMHQSLTSGSSVSPRAVKFCHQHDIGVIAGGCPMMYGDGVDLGHRCLRWLLEFKGLPLESGARR